MLEEHEKINEKIVRDLIDNEYSYILVFKESRNNIIGTIKVKEFAIKYLKT
jgi:CBS domain containing-hemolysin-like protein